MNFEIEYMWKGNRFLSFANNISENLNKNLSGKYTLKIYWSYIKKLLQIQLKLHQKNDWKNSSIDVIGKNIANTITKNSIQINSETSPQTKNK